jgi:hypothetical protein
MTFINIFDFICQFINNNKQKHTKSISLKLETLRFLATTARFLPSPIFVPFQPYPAIVYGFRLPTERDNVLLLLRFLQVDIFQATNNVESVSASIIDCLNSVSHAIENTE